MSKVEMKVGEYYETVDGIRWYCFAKLPVDSTAPFCCCDYDGDCQTFTQDGMWYTDGSDSSNDLVLHLPDCTGFDWVPAPKLQLREGGWYQLRNGKIVGPCSATGASASVEFRMACGKTYYANGSRMSLHSPHPEDAICEVDPPKPIEPTYRAFKGKDEFYPYRDNWITRKDAVEEHKSICKVLSFSDSGCTVSTCSLHAVKTWKEMFCEWVFVGGVPFGVLDHGT